MRIDVTMFPGLGMCTYQCIDCCKAKVVQSFTFEYGIMGKVVREVKSKQEQEKTVKDKHQNEDERILNRKQ